MVSFCHCCCLFGMRRGYLVGACSPPWPGQSSLVGLLAHRTPRVSPRQSTPSDLQTQARHLWGQGTWPRGGTMGVRAPGIEVGSDYAFLAFMRKLLRHL